jgi:hypothetical protein
MNSRATRIDTDKPEDLSDAAINKLLRYDLFRSVCRILAAATPKKDRRRLSRQRAALEKKLGYDSFQGKP